VCVFLPSCVCVFLPSSIRISPHLSPSRHHHQACSAAASQPRQVHAACLMIDSSFQLSLGMLWESLMCCPWECVLPRGVEAAMCRGGGCIDTAPCNRRAIDASFIISQQCPFCMTSKHGSLIRSRIGRSEGKVGTCAHRLHTSIGSYLWSTMVPFDTIRAESLQPPQRFCAKHALSSKFSSISKTIYISSGSSVYLAHT